MSDKLSSDALQALKIAFSYMPNAIEVTKYEYGDHYQVVLEHIETVKEILLLNDVDPEEVQGEIYPEHTPNSSYLAKAAVTAQHKTLAEIFIAY